MTGWKPMWKRLPPQLKAGERIRLTPGGPVLEVVRVSPCAAYVGRVVQGKPFQAWDPQARAYKTVLGIARMEVEAISRYAFVERVGDDSGEEEAGDGEG